MAEIEELVEEYARKIKLKPKEQWICDHCKEIIEDISDGWLEWYTEGDQMIESGFRIVHNRERCLYDQRYMFSRGKSTSDMHLDYFAGDSGLVILLSHFVDGRLKDNEEFIEIIRRIHVAYYEEARQYWDQANEDGYFDGANEILPYLPETSLRVIGEYASYD